jgi:hypothetical protein
MVVFAHRESRNDEVGRVFGVEGQHAQGEGSKVQFRAIIVVYARQDFLG